MKILGIAILVVATVAVSAQTGMKQPDVKMYKQQPPRVVGTDGIWLDTTLDTIKELWISYGSGKLLFTEDYEIAQTHEVCATVSGYFMEASQMGRYDVLFKGFRNHNQLEFTTQFDAEKVVQNACTAASTPVR